jgi:C-terminal processing protease CtpA/Prc
MMGLLKDQEYTTSSGVSWRTRFVRDDSALVIESLYDASELADAGLAVGDTILTVNGEHMTRDDADEFSLNNDAPQKVELVVTHAGVKSKHTVILAHPRSTRTAKHDIAPDPNAPPQARAIRKQIYGG